MAAEKTASLHQRYPKGAGKKKHVEVCPSCQHNTNYQHVLFFVDMDCPAAKYNNSMTPRIGRRKAVLKITEAPGSRTETQNTQMRSNEIRVLRFLDSWFALNLWNLVLVVRQWALHILSHFLSRAQEAKSRIYSDSGHLDESIFWEANCWGSIRWKFPSVAQFFGSTTIGTSFRFLQGRQFCHISRITADTTVAI